MVGGNIEEKILCVQHWYDNRALNYRLSIPWHATKSPFVCRTLIITYHTWNYQTPPHSLQSHERHGVSNHLQPICSFSSLLRRATKETSTVPLLSWHHRVNIIWQMRHDRRDHVTFLSQCHHQSNYMLERSAYCWFLYHCITVTSQWARWRLKWPASQFLLNHSFRRRSRKYQSSASLAFVYRNSPVTGEFPEQRASSAKTVSIWWRHHGMSNYYNVPQ